MLFLTQEFSLLIAYAIMDEECSATNILLIAAVTSELVHYISFLA